ncbi:uncharacterized protein LOC124551107 [Schistocerca americana]|uniref:uncharacterized protein LOC124551107 n=1 Tax=Schistocerca americana TaxID=7009 RepID=UPI001F4FED78|nr:uncharacterized protein LOC124551107 [Schistocerca americana]
MIDFNEETEVIAEVLSQATTLSIAQSGAANNSTPKRRKLSEEGSYSSALQLIAERLQTNSDDDTFVKYLATEMKAIRSHETRMLVTQQILQLLYEAVLNQ